MILLFSWESHSKSVNSSPLINHNNYYTTTLSVGVRNTEGQVSSDSEESVEIWSTGIDNNGNSDSGDMHCKIEVKK